MRRYCVVIALLAITGCSKLTVVDHKSIGKVISADCVNGGWGTVDKTIIKTDHAVVPVRYCSPVQIGDEAWLTTYRESSWLLDNQCWLYTSGRSYNCGY